MYHKGFNSVRKRLGFIEKFSLLANQKEALCIMYETLSDYSFIESVSVADHLVGSLLQTLNLPLSKPHHLPEPNPPGESQRSASLRYGEGL